MMTMIATAPPSRVTYAQESMQQLCETVRRLPFEEREVFLLRQNGGWTYEQIAHLHTRPVGVVKDQMRRALRKLRRVFEGLPSG